MAQAGSIMRGLILALALLVLGTPARAEESAPSSGFSLRGLLSLNPFSGARTDTRRVRRASYRRARVARASRLEAADASHPNSFDAIIAAQARANGVPESLIHRVIKRESRYNAGAVGRGGAMGLMQIKHSTARAIGYTGPPSGLLDPETNLIYGVRYLAGALLAAGGNPERGYALYRSGYYKARRGSRAMPAPRVTARTNAPDSASASTLGLRRGSE